MPYDIEYSGVPAVPTRVLWNQCTYFDCILKPLLQKEKKNVSQKGNKFLTKDAKGTEAELHRLLIGHHENW